jgi:hypothetical protein
MSDTKIAFYKVRDFGEKMGATVDFLRVNVKKLALSLLLIGGPVAVLVSLVFRDMFTNFFDLSSMDSGRGMGDVFAKLGVDYLLMMFLTWVTMMMIVGITYQFMIRYNNDDLADFSIGELFSTALSKLPGLILLSFLIFIVVFLGFLLFIIPGIYLAVTLSLAYPIFLFEKDAGIGEAFTKPFKIITGKWWSTFGVLFIGWIMAYAVSLVFSIPFSVVYVDNLFSAVKEGDEDPNAIMSMFSSGYMTLAMALSNLGSYMSYSVPLIALAYQYSNLVERKEGKGLLSEIHDFDKAD